MPSPPAPVSTIDILINRQSGRLRSAPEKTDRLLALLGRERHIRLHEIVRLEQAPPIIRNILADIADPPQMLLAIGGDGTIREAVAGLAGSALPLAIFPGGTANVFALEHGLPFDPAQAAAMIRQGRTKAFYPGQIDSADAAESGRPQFFLQMIGAGVDGAIVDAVSWELKKRLGKAAYAAALFKTLAKIPVDRFSVVRGGKESACFGLIASTGSRYAGNYRLFPHPPPEPQSLNFCFQKWGKFPALAGLLLRCLGFPPKRLERWLRFETAREMVFRAPPFMQRDGDVFAHETGRLLKISRAETPIALVIPAAKAV